MELKINITCIPNGWSQADTLGELAEILEDATLLELNTKDQVLTGDNIKVSIYQV